MTVVTRHIIGRAQSVPRKAVPDVAPPELIECKLNLCYSTLHCDKQHILFLFLTTSNFKRPKEAMILSRYYLLLPIVVLRRSSRGKYVASFIV